MTKKKKFETWYESEAARIDGLIAELKEQKAELKKEEREDPAAKAPGAVLRQAAGRTLAYVLYSGLGGLETTEVEITGGFASSVTVTLHHLHNLSNEEMEFLKHAANIWEAQEGAPHIRVSAFACSEHLNCLAVEFDAWFAEEEWKEMMEAEKNG